MQRCYFVSARTGHSINVWNKSGIWIQLSETHLIADLMESRGPFDQPLREFEYAQMTFDAVMDQGAYFEFKRHRMMTQTVQSLTALLGFAVPKGIAESGCEQAYLQAMRQAGDLYRELADVESGCCRLYRPQRVQPAGPVHDEFA